MYKIHYFLRLSTLFLHLSPKEVTHFYIFPVPFLEIGVFTHSLKPQVLCKMNNLTMTLQTHKSGKWRCGKWPVSVFMFYLDITIIRLYRQILIIIYFNYQYYACTNNWISSYKMWSKTRTRRTDAISTIYNFVFLAYMYITFKNLR